MYILTEEKEIQLYNVLEKLYVDFEKDIIDNPKRISNVISDLLPDYTKKIAGGGRGKWMGRIISQ